MSYHTLKSLTYHSFQDGPHLVILGGVHGNEICGPIAIQRVIEQLDNNILELIAGKLTLVPLCNPKANYLNTRYVDRNLNRELYTKDIKQHYEDYIDPILCSIIETADYLLDLHSFHSPGGPFVFLGGQCKAEQQFARSLGVDHFVYGWAEAYSQHKDHNTSKKNESLGTVEFARLCGAKAATLECGHHLNHDAPDIGEQAIKNALAHLSMIDAPPIEPSDQQTCAKMKSVFYRNRPGHFAKPWVHFDSIEAGEAIIQYDDGTTEVAPEQGFLILPKAESAMGAEWVYFGIPAPFPCAE